MIKREDIYRIAKNDSIVRMAISYYKRKDISWEEAMMIAVAGLSAQNEELRKIMERSAMTMDSPISVMRGGVWEKDLGEKEE